MRRISRMEKRKIMKGWYKWTALPAILFVAFFADAWLNVHALQQDIKISILDRQRRNLEKEMHEVLAEETTLLGIDHLNQMAEHMGFGPPALQQVETLAYREIPRRIPVLDVPSDTGLRVVYMNPAPISNVLPETGTRLAATPSVISSSTLPAYPNSVTLHREDLGAGQDALITAGSGPIMMNELTNPSDNELGLEHLLGKL